MSDAVLLFLAKVGLVVSSIVLLACAGAALLLALGLWEHHRHKDDWK